MSRHPVRAALAVLALVLAGGTTACTEMSGSTSKAGGDPSPITLTMGVDDSEGRPASDQLTEFARQVERLSGGSLVVDPKFRVNGSNQPAWDQKLARRVVDGDLDLGLVPSRAWDTEGVDTLRALSAPLLVTTEAATNSVVTDDALAGDLMAGLDELGLTGLALVPESLRHLFVYGAPTLGAGELRGAVVRAPRSDTVWAFLQALGAHPTDAPADDSFTMAESSFALAPAGVLRTAVGNAPLFPKVNVVAANSDALEELSAEHQQVLREAAVATRDWAVERNASEQDQAVAWCADGLGDVTHADAAVQAALRDAAEVVMTDLRKDAGTAQLLDRVEAMTPPSAASALPTCRRDKVYDMAAGTSVEPIGGDLPDGTYRAEYTEEFLRSRVQLEENVTSNRGVWTFELDDGQWSFEQVAPDFVDSSEGVYEVRGRQLYWALDEGQVLHFTWSTDEEGDLHFNQVRDMGADVDPKYPFPDFQFDLEWVRVE